MKTTHKQSRTTKRLSKRKRKKRLLTFVLIPLIVLFGGVSIYLGSVYNKAQNVFEGSYEDDGRDKGSELRDDIVNPKDHNVSILFVGVDKGGGRDGDADSGLSDALMLATFNVEDKSVKLLSIPRDSYVYIPSRDSYTKITHAHAYGGIKESIETVEHLFEMPVDYYVRLDFDAFIDVVEALDGIKVDVPYAISEMDSHDVKGAIQLDAGEQWLNGEEALALARTRKYDNDFERGNRQQMILEAILDRVISVNALANINNLLEAVGNNMKTNMSFDEMKDFSSYISNKLQIDTLNLEGSDLITDAYYFELDEAHLEEIKTELHNHLGLDEEDQE
jgi:LCP family protein required for cell wall assembly